MNFNNFFSELKRRRVYKTAVAYGVFSWLLVQVGTTILPAFDAPLFLSESWFAIALRFKVNE